MKLNDEFDKINPPKHLESRVRAQVDEARYKKLPGRRWRINRLVAIAAALLVVLAFGIPYMTAFNPKDGVSAFKTKGQLENYFRSFKTDSFWNRLINWGSKSAEDSFEMSTQGPNGSTGTAGSEHSTTNNQVQGVSESDIVHTDGNYIYSVSYYNLLVVEAATLKTVTSIKYDNFYPDSMFLLEDEGLLVVLGSEYNTIAFGGTKNDILIDYCYWRSNTTVIKLYDIKTLTKGGVETVREWKYENSFSNSARVIDGKLYLLMNSYNVFIDNALWIPTSYSSETGKTAEIPIKDIYALPGNNGSVSYIMYAGIDLNSNDTVFKTFVGSMSNLYASKNAFYAAYYGYESFITGYRYYTGVNRFEIDGLDLQFSGNAKVDGNIINQFAMDEYTYASGALKGKTLFRIATTGQGSAGSMMTVFDSEMNQVGKLTGLGEKNERIYSVRYDGDRAVVVTYLNMDPLYVIDLSALNPKIISELKIRGVSDYLHFLSVRENTVFAIGRKQADGGNWLDGIKVSMFDVSGSEAAREIAYFEVSSVYSYSEATYNHKAVMYFKPSAGGSEVFAFPVDTGVYSPDQRYYYTNSSLYYYTATADGALKQDILDYKSEKESYKTNSTEYYYYMDGIRRSVIIGEYVYLIGYYGITRYDRGDFTIVPEVVSFGLTL